MWIKFFLKGVAFVANEACETSNRIINLQARDKNKIIGSYKKSANIASLHDKLFDRPIISIKDAANMMDVTFPTANNICIKLAKLGILKEVTGKARNKMFVYKDYLDMLKE